MRQLGFISLARAAITCAFGKPTVESSAISWRFILLFATISPSISVSEPTPLRISASAAYEPTPPTPKRTTLALFSRVSPSLPIKA